MGRKLTGTVRQSTVERPQKNGQIYVYSRESWYDPTIRNTRSKMKLLGIRDPESGEVKQTRPKKQNPVNAPAATPVAVVTRANAMLRIVRYYCDLSGVTNEVMSALPNSAGDAQKILTLAWYAFANSGKTWTGANAWTARHLDQMPYPHGSISKDMYEDLFHYIGRTPGISESIFAARAAQFGKGELIAWDSTTYECGVNDVHDAVAGEHKDGLTKVIYKVFFFYSVTSRQLIGFKKIHGNTPDCITVAYALQAVKAWNLNTPEILQDNGYTNVNTIGELLHSGLHFVTRMLPAANWISPVVKKHLESLVCGTFPSQIIYCEPEFSGVACKVKHKFPYTRTYGSRKKGLSAGDTDYIEATINVFIYYSSSKKGADDKKFRTTACRIRESMLMHRPLDKDDRAFAEKYLRPVMKQGELADVEIDPVAQSAAMKNHGLLVLISDHEKDINRALQKFRTRERIEESIKGHKSYTGGDSSKTGSDEFLEGELLIEFLANSIRESMLSRFRYLKQVLGVPNGNREHDAKENLELEASLVKWINKNSIQQILDTFDTCDIREVYSNGRSSKLTVNATKRDQLMLNLHGMNEWGTPGHVEDFM